MATKLFLRNTQNNSIGSTYYDMVTVAGAALDTAVVASVNSGTEIQWTKTSGGSIVQWISGRAPAGGFTLTTTDISIWALEASMNANCGGGYRVFKRTAAGSESELGGGRYDDGVEFAYSVAGEVTWTGNPTDTAFAENDRILLKIYIVAVGTMAGPYDCTLSYNAADAATGDSFFNIAETVAFKAEPVTDVFHEGLSRIAQGDKPNTAAGMGGILWEKRDSGMVVPKKRGFLYLGREVYA